MKKIIRVIKNIFSIEELSNKIYFTLILLLVFRLGSYIVLPGVDPTKLQEAQGIFGLFNVFLGGAFSRASIFALGIMPYISASIVVQLMQVAVPYFQKLQKEGESGRRRITQITRILTIFITMGQSIAYLSTAIPAEAILISPTFFKFSSMVILTSGTVFCMWLGEKITERGIGNGISMLIMIGIVSSLPGAIIEEVSSRAVSGSILLLVIELVIWYFVVLFVVLITQAIRRIPIQYARRLVRGGNRDKGSRSYLPIKVNSANVMPIIFAQSLMFLPAMVANIWIDSSDFARYIAQSFSSFNTWEYNLTFVILIIVFTFFYTAITVNPQQMSDDLKRNNAFIPGVKSGQSTTDFIAKVIDNITLPGALLLAAVAILPAFASLFGVNANFSRFYGGTSLIIMVGVILDTLQQVESYLLMRKYETMMSSGKLTSRADLTSA